MKQFEVQFVRVTVGLRQENRLTRDSREAIHTCPFETETGSESGKVFSRGSAKGAPWPNLRCACPVDDEECQLPGGSTDASKHTDLQFFIRLSDGAILSGQ